MANLREISRRMSSISSTMQVTRTMEMISTARIRKALAHVPAERIIVAPDCGLKYLPREVAFGKMRAMVEGAKIVRAELG